MIPGSRLNPFADQGKIVVVVNHDLGEAFKI
jgi:hypothetical protein